MNSRLPAAKSNAVRPFRSFTDKSAPYSQRSFNARWLPSYAARKKVGVNVFQPDVDEDTPLKYGHLREKVFDGLNGDELAVPDGTEWRDRVMLLPPDRNGAMTYRPELPFITDMDLSFAPYRLRGELELVLTAAEYVPYPKRTPPEVQWKRQMRFPIALEGDEIAFQAALYRNQDATEEELSIMAKPKFAGIALADRFYRLRIVTADNFCRVYLDDRLVWGGCLAFHGGYFKLRYRTDEVLKIGSFSVYDAGLVQPGEKRRSRLKLPLPPPEPVAAPAPAPTPASEPTAPIPAPAF